MSRTLASGLIVAATVGAAIAVAVGGDGGGGLLVLAYLLTVPGLAATLHMGPMSLEARSLVTVAASCVIGAVVAGVLLYLDQWSPRLGFGVIAGLALLAGIVPGRQGLTVAAGLTSDRG